MNSKLDRIKSTITISLGTKNRLRKLKGSESYEEFINYLMRLRNQTVHKADNLIELQKFNRKKGIYSDGEYKIVFSYNGYNQSQNFWFDIAVDQVRKKGRKVDLITYNKEISSRTNKDRIQIMYKTYFQLLETAIQKEIEHLFRHKGRFEDYWSWEQEFKTLNLPMKSFKEDVMDRLIMYENERGDSND